MPQKNTKADIMESRLRESLDVTSLQIENQSALHKGHAGDDGSGESHYLIRLSSPDLECLSRLEKHKKVFKIIGKDITDQTHSLSLRIE